MTIIKSISENILDGTDLDHKLDLKFHEVKLRVSTNSGELVKVLSEYYGDFCCEPGHEDTTTKPDIKRGPDIKISAVEGSFSFQGITFKEKKPDPPKTRIKEEYFEAAGERIVRKVLTGMIFIFSANINIAIGKCLKNSNQVINFINNRYIEYMLRNGCLLFHAAAVSRAQKGIAICGFSGAGKSTLALKLLESGLYFLSNDRLLARNKNYIRARMYGVPKLPRVNPGTILSSRSLIKIIPEDERKVFKELHRDDLWELEHKYDIYIDKIFGKGKFIMETDMYWFFILNWKRNSSDTEIKKVNLDDRKDLLPAFIKSPGLFYTPDKHSINTDFTAERYIELLKSCDVYEISGGIDFEKAADFILKLIK